MLFSFSKGNTNGRIAQASQEPSVLDASTGGNDLSDAQLAEIYGGFEGVGSGGCACNRHFDGFEDFPFAGTGLLGILFGPVL